MTLNINDYYSLGIAPENMNSKMKDWRVDRYRRNNSAPFVKKKIIYIKKKDDGIPTSVWISAAATIVAAIIAANIKR